jgi:cobalt-zinc-cadmium efflux system outer membrane protein
MSTRLSSVLFTMLALARAAAAQPPSAPPVPGDDPGLDALVAEALAANPDLRALEEAARAARQRPAQVSALPDPVLGLAYTNETWGLTLGRMDDTNLALSASQGLPFPGKRRLRGEIASREADEVDQRVARARLGVAASVRRAYAALLQARALRALVDEQGGIWGQIEGVTRARYGVGQGNQQDVLRAQVEITRIGQLTAEQDAEAAVRTAELARLLGRATDTQVEAPGALHGVAAAGPVAAELERLRAISPELAAARSAVERARLQVALARKEYRPDFAVQAAYMNRGGLDPMWQAGVALTLPLDRKRREAAVAESEALLRAAESRGAAVELQLRFRTEERLAQLEAVRATTTLYQEGIVPQDRMSVEAAVASYQAGRAPFLVVLEALTTLYGDRVTLVRLLAGQARLRASLDEASLEATPESLSVIPAAMAGGAGAASAAARGTPSGAMGSMGNQ